MADPILGRAYPALIAPGLRVVVETRGFGAARYEGLVVEATDGGAEVFGITGDPVVNGVVWNIGYEHLRIDYADPHTRDRVCRALEAHYIESGVRWPRSPYEDVIPLHPLGLPWGGAGMARWGSPDHESRYHALRAIADAVWGEEVARG